MVAIPPPSVTLIDPQTSLMAKPWYDWFLDQSRALSAQADIGKTFEYFGAVASSPTFDNTPALNKYNDYITENGQTNLLLKGELYSFLTPPNAFTSQPIDIEGHGANGTVLRRDYNGSGGAGFIQLTGVSGSKVRFLSLNAGNGTSGGDMLQVKSTSSNGASGNHFQEVTIAAEGTGSYGRGLVFDGTAKVTGSLGTRSNTLVGVKVFSATDASVELRKCVSFSWMGGYFLNPGGVGCRVINDGTINPADIQAVLSNASGDLDLTFVQDFGMRATSLGGSIHNDGNCNNCWFAGRVTGTVQALWTNSGVTAN